MGPVGLARARLGCAVPSNIAYLAAMPSNDGVVGPLCPVRRRLDPGAMQGKWMGGVAAGDACEGAEELARLLADQVWQVCV